jgi:hypothetical protein
MSSVSVDEYEYDEEKTFNFGITIPNAEDPTANLIAKEDTSSLLILHLKVPLGTKKATVVQDDTSDAIKHRDGCFTDAEFLAYKPNLNIPSPYEEHLSESTPCLISNNEADGCAEQTAAEHTEPSHEFKTNGGSGMPAGSAAGATHASVLAGTVCWWCCHGFECQPVQLPIGKTTDKARFFTAGTFCSTACAAAYNFECGDKYGSAKAQYAMLHEMVSLDSQAPTTKIQLAPPRESLSIFGGKYDISSFRKLAENTNVQVNMTIVPINAACVAMEEISLEQAYASKIISEVPIDIERLKKANTELRLKRKKKQKDENTLESFMQLKISE